MAKKASKAGGFTKTQAKAVVNALNTDMAAFQKAVKQLQADLDQLQKGDGTTSFWSGERAYVWIKAALGHVDHDTVLLDHLDNCVDYFDQLVRGGSAL